MSHFTYHAVAEGKHGEHDYFPKDGYNEFVRAHDRMMKRMRDFTVAHKQLIDTEECLDIFGRSEEAWRGLLRSEVEEKLELEMETLVADSRFEVETMEGDLWHEAI